MENAPGNFEFIKGSGDFLVLMAAFVLAFGVLGIVDFLGRNARTGKGRIVGLISLLLLLAALPVWATTLYLLLASIGQDPHQFWSVAPWLVIVAWFRFGGVFIGGALLSGLVYVAWRGEHREKWAPMQMCMLLMVFGVIMYAAFLFAKAHPHHY